MVTIYHNSRCSKSRGACEILSGKGVQAEVIEYLKNPPTELQISELLGKLDMKASELVRRSEDIFKDQFSGKNYSEAEWLSILAKNPILIERPIIVMGNKAIIGRPPERILELLEKAV
ncbi:arsenate reductase (glutaredoxin) [Flavihumibacter sp. R14]|nr:arsenate reductase (glutaredoxin) [Flavihumibacter soli]